MVLKFSRNEVTWLFENIVYNITIEVNVYTDPPTIYQPTWVYPYVYCKVDKLADKFYVRFHKLDECYALHVSFLLWEPYILYPYWLNWWHQGNCTNRFKCEATYGEMKFSIIYELLAWKKPPTQIDVSTVRVDVDEAFVFTWEERPICCNFEGPNSKYSYALWWEHIKGDNGFKNRINCIYPNSSQHGNTGFWNCIYRYESGEINVLSRNFVFLGTNEMELEPTGDLDRIAHFKHRCRFKNTTLLEGYLWGQAMWSFKSHIVEGLDIIYHEFTGAKLVRIYCSYKYRGETIQSKLDDIYLSTPWVPSIEISQDDWKSQESINKQFFKHRLKNINCQVVSPYDENSGHFLATWTVHSRDAHYKPSIDDPQVLVPVIGVMAATSSYTCFTNILGHVFSLDLHITALDAKLLITTGPEVALVNTYLLVTCMPIPDMVSVDSAWFLVKRNNTDVVQEGLFENPRKLNLLLGWYTVSCNIPGSAGLIIPRTIYFKDIPSLVLSNPTMKDFIVDGFQFAECVMQWKTPGGASAGDVKWCNIKDSNNAVAHKNKLYFNIPHGGYQKQEVECCYEYNSVKTSKMFTFNVYDPHAIQIGSFPDTSKEILHMEDKCDDICQSNWAQLNENPGLHVQIVDPNIIDYKTTSFRIVVTKNRYKCENVDHPVCFETTCNARFNNYIFPPVIRRRCYIQEMKSISEIVPKESNIPVGGSYSCISDDMATHFTGFTWQVTREDGKSIPLPTGILRVTLFQSFAGMQLELKCSPKFYSLVVGWTRQSIQVSSTLEITLKHENENCIKPGEVITCLSPLSVKLPEIILRHFDKQSFYKDKGTDWVRVPDNIYLTYYTFGCRIEETRYTKTNWFTFPVCITKPELVLSRESVRMGTRFNCRALDYDAQRYRLKVEGLDENNPFGKYCPFAMATGYSVFDVICPFGNVLVRCSAYLTQNNSEYLVASTIFEMELLAYEPFFQEEHLSYDKMSMAVLCITFVIWFCLISFNLCLVTYLCHHSNMKRLVLLELIHEWNLGGTRNHIRYETDPFIYIRRAEVDGDTFRHLQNCIENYATLLELGQSVYFLWLTGFDPIRLEIVKIFRELAILDPERASTYYVGKYWKKMERGSIFPYQQTRGSKLFSRLGTHNPNKPNFGAFVAKL